MVSSTVHLVLSTTPFLLLFLYFTYSAYNRPNIIFQRDDDEGDINPLIPLTDMLLIILGNLLLWSFLFVYLAFFVRRRRRLMKSYLRGLPGHKFHHLNSNNDLTVSPTDASGKTQFITKTTTGYVYYHHPKSWLGRLCNSFTYTDKAYLVYRHPDESGMFVQKHIRTYHPYHRENVSVIYLANEPLSGLSKDDVDRDVGSYTSEYAIRSRDKIHQVIIVCAHWIIISTVIASYILNQVAVVDEIDGVGIENWYKARNSFLVMICGVIPIVAVFVNIVRWKLYYQWIVKGGQVVQEPIQVPRVLERDEFENEQEASRYVAMA